MPKLADNKRALHDYEILEIYEAGLVLTGAEVKSIKGGRMNLAGSYVIPKGTELWLTGAQIAAYPPARSHQIGYDPAGDRKLLLRSGELTYLLGKAKQEGLTLVPVSVYTKHSLIKLELGLARGKTRYDKRASLRRKDAAKEMRQRSLK